MYTQYFGLTEKPFSIAPDPHFLYLSELHREALAHLLYGIERGGCLVLLTGEVGTGKTTVSRCLVEQLPEATDIALILNPKLTVFELLTTICEELGIAGIEAQGSVKHPIDALNRHLLNNHAKGRNTVLIIDEAQDLDPDILEQLRLLTNLETDKEKLLKIILIGQPELRETLNRPGLTQINQRITSRYHLLPLQEQDVFAYITHRCKIAGTGRASLFSDKAVKRIHKLSQGIPRLINLLCDRALLGAYVEGKDQVDRDIVDRAGREVLDPSRTMAARRSAFFPPLRFPAVLAASLILALLFTGTALVFFSDHLGGLFDKKTPSARVTAPLLSDQTKKKQVPTQPKDPGGKRTVHELHRKNEERHDNAGN